jgi:ABC-type Fe3+-hydroxamate transport system substrate-binding protein
MSTPYFSSPPRRIVSLVPSLTESLFDLGMGSTLAGITDYCIHPAEKLAGLPRLGGTKNPKVEAIIALQPDLVLASREENTREAVQALEAAGLQVWVTFPRSVDEALADLRTLADFFQSRYAYLAVDMMERSVEFLRASLAELPHRRVFCPIWRDEHQGAPWYMTANAETYASDVLKLFGAENVFAGRSRRYPLEADLGLAAEEPAGERDTRYPRVTLDEIRAARPEMILLLSEPFAFGRQHIDELGELLAGTPAVESGHIHLVDGSLLTWPGTRLGKALLDLPEQLGK